jgi:HD-like signal output (HDOD) protein
MKTLKYAALTFLILGLASQYSAFAETADTLEHHKTLAASYQEKAAVQDGLIAEHQQMKKDYEKRYTPGNASKVGVPARVTEMQAHCDKLITAATQEKQELLDFAKWHQMRASELQGR